MTTTCVDLGLIASFANFAAKQTVVRGVHRVPACCKNDDKCDHARNLLIGKLLSMTQRNVFFLIKRRKEKMLIPFSLLVSLMSSCCFLTSKFRSKLLLSVSLLGLTSSNAGLRKLA